MLRCYRLIETTSEYLLYSYGCEDDHHDGLLKITTGDNIKMEIIRESADNRVNRDVALEGALKLVKAYQEGETLQYMAECEI